MRDEDSLRLRRRAEALDAYVRSVAAHVKAESNPLRGQRYFTPEEHIAELYKIILHLTGAVVQMMKDTSDALEKKN